MPIFKQEAYRFLGYKEGDLPVTSKMVKNILNAANLHDLIGGETIASGQGLLARVKRTPVVLFQLDEFGLMIQALRYRNASQYSREIPRNIIRLYSSSDSIFGGTEYADQTNRPTVQIKYPCVSIHATTTPESFYISLESKDIINGFINRFIVVDMSNKPIPPIKKRGLYPDVPKSILKWIKQVINTTSKIGNLDLVNTSNPYVVYSSPEGAALLTEFTHYADYQIGVFTDTGTASLWGRAAEHAHKIALVCACAENIDHPQIEKSHAEWAIRFIGTYTEYLAKQVKAHVADTDFEKHLNDFYLAIISAGYQGITEREMNRRKPFCSYSPRDRNPIIDTLLKGGKIALQRTKTTSAGRPRMAYIACSIDAEDHT